MKYHTTSFAYKGFNSKDTIYLSPDGKTIIVSFQTFAGEMWTEIPIRVLYDVIEESENILNKDIERLVDDVRD